MWGGDMTTVARVGDRGRFCSNPCVCRTGRSFVGEAWLNRSRLDGWPFPWPEYCLPHMAAFSNPALGAFAALMGDGFEFGQVVISPAEAGFELRHVADAGVATMQLKDTPVPALRQLAQTTAAGGFRPNKTAPTLRMGWRSVARDAAELEEALRHLYPGALADWHAARQLGARGTTFREFVGRQTGRNARAQVLADDAVAEVTRSCCAPARCLRRRLWTVGGGPPEAALGKSVIPCFEPCALMLDAAREAAGSGTTAANGAG